MSKLALIRDAPIDAPGCDEDGRWKPERERESKPDSSPLLGPFRRPPQGNPIFFQSFLMPKNSSNDEEGIMGTLLICITMRAYKSSTYPQNPKIFGA
jgi:hypothetical protein